MNYDTAFWVHVAVTSLYGVVVALVAHARGYKKGVRDGILLRSRVARVAKFFKGGEEQQNASGSPHIEPSTPWPKK